MGASTSVQHESSESHSGSSGGSDSSSSSSSSSSGSSSQPPNKSNGKLPRNNSFQFLPPDMVRPQGDQSICATARHEYSGQNRQDPSCAIQ
ncbi:putative uncharacterized protein DDB_G0277255 [Acanthopagrus latus]|uniref:putative uncharacterized protein DDB_G0277255 n=1 Tax=Acanthopagrus latus TaxID=8177 RepID=UPI00187C10CE|nr:putative uncharacterized protein DDB_G0277255 [Acanthopagrus latus]XP_036972056.1 putative uncharacterized protein DDB_G0277255 [Acanthopagrus latus]